MFSYLWPLGLIVLSNVFYQICAKSVPENLNPFASLTVTYAVGALLSLLLCLVTGKNMQMAQLSRAIHWAPLVLGLAIVGLEAGNIYAYQAGWEIGKLPIVQAAILAILLIFVGYLLYREAITWNKILGILVCIGGLVLLNRN